MLVWLYYVLLLVVLIIGWLANIFGLPGLWMMVLGHIIYAWATGWAYSGLKGIVTLVVLALAAEITEFLAGAAGTKNAGGTKRGMAGAVAGGLAGGIGGQILIPIPVVGAILGAVAGSFLGATSIEKLVDPDTRRALRIGYGAAKGRLLGILIKSGIGLVMGVFSLIAAFPVGGPPPLIPTTQPITPMTPTTSRPATAPTTLPATQP